MINKFNANRRKLLKWSTPVVAAVALPSHAQMSLCTSAPLMTANSPSKCAGDPPIGQAVVSLLSDGLDPMDATLTITEIVVSGQGADDTVEIPALPVEINTTDPLEIEWTGPGSDALTCLPLSTITFEVTYSCSVEAPGPSNFNLTEVLSEAIV